MSYNHIDNHEPGISADGDIGYFGGCLLGAEGRRASGEVYDQG
jgi:hypothetical protein